MIHHVSLEVRPDDAEALLGLFEILGYLRVAPPLGLEEGLWLERSGTQVHLLRCDDPNVPRRGHLATVVDDFEACLARVEAAGHRVGRRRAYWGAPRALVEAPGGHLVELMAAPPDPGVPLSGPVN